MNSESFGDRSREALRAIEVMEGCVRFVRRKDGRGALQALRNFVIEATALHKETQQVQSEGARLSLDVSAEHARALHRIVRSMHDGHCPKCSYLGSSDAFYPPERIPGQHRCPVCGFFVTDEEVAAALAAFRPHLQASVELFENWRKSRDE